MSYNIVYGLRTVKVAAPVGGTVGGLIDLAKKSFKLAPELSVLLIHKGKALDSSKPLRFTNLVNNAKLELKVVEGRDTETTLKLTVTSPNGTVLNHVVTTKVNVTIDEMISTIKQENAGLILDFEGYKPYIMDGINHKVMQEDFLTTKLGSIIGYDTKRAGLRLAYNSENTLKLLEREKEQQEVVRKQLIAQKEWKQKIQREEEAKRLEKERLEAETVVAHQTNPRVKEHNPVSIDPIPQRERTPSNSQEEPTQIETEKDVEMLTEENHKYVLPQEPQVYLPADSHNVYEHNDEVYNMTVAQAQAYHKLITRTLRPHKPTSLVKSIPDRYTIRVRFPDRVTLQLLFDNGSEVKFGALLKKLDELILPEFRNSYILKFASPPFTTIPFNFTTNNTHLHELKVSKNSFDVFSERTSLIFESISKKKGPFVVQDDILIKTQQDRPEVQVESSRDTMPMDKEVVVELNRTEFADEKKKPVKGTPKWLKIGKK